MSLNFFKNIYNVNSVIKFGIIDPAQNHANPNPIAYVDYTNKRLWNTTVISNNRTDIYFCPIDGNIIFYKSWRNNEKQRSCDAMLYTNEKIVFLEIKDWAHDNDGITYIESAVEQLENTIVHFCTAHPDYRYTKKYAYISNKKIRPVFTTSLLTTMQKFKDNTNGFILKIDKEILF